MTERSRFSLGVLLAGLSIAYGLLAAALPPLDDEAYYWCWAQELQLSYFDHAPLSAYMIWLSTSLLGDSVFAMRLPALMTSLVVVAVLWELMSPRWLWPYVLMTPLFTFGAILITPDTPLLLFWSLYLLWLVKLQERLTTAAPQPLKNPWLWWLLGGVLLGLGGLGKYTMVLAVPASAWSFWLARRIPGSKWIPGFLAHGVVAGLITTPVFWFNWEHDFTPLQFQWNHANATNHQGWASLGGFLGTQIILFGLLPLALWPWFWSRRRSWQQEAKLRVCGCLYLLPMTFFLYKACRGPLEGNWALAAYLGFWPVAAWWHATMVPASWQRPVRVLGLGAPFLATLLLGLHLMVPLPGVSPKADRLHRQTGRWLAAQTAAHRTHQAASGRPVYAATYQWTALLRLAGTPAYQLRGVTRPSHFTLPGSTPTDLDEFILWNESTLPEGYLPQYECVEELACVPIVVRGEVVSCMRLLRYRLKYPQSPGGEILGVSPQNPSLPRSVALTADR